MKKTDQSPEFRDAAIQLTIKDLFFTALLYTLKIEQHTTMPSVAGTDGVRLMYNPELFAKYDRSDRIFILAHEIMHVVLFHSFRRGVRNPLIWNIAADYVINLMLSEHGYKKIPEGCLFDEQFKGMTTEEVYDKIVSDAKKSGIDLEKMLKPIFRDVKDYDPATNGGRPAKEVERDIGKETAKAAESAKAAGKESRLLDRFVESMAVVKQPWYTLLAPYMNSYNSKEYNWMRPDFRRSAVFKMLVPKIQSESMGKAVVGVDCSGSMDDVQLASISSHISDMMTECRPSAVEVVFFDTQILRKEEYTGPHYDIHLKMVGGGGTDFHPVVEYAESVDDCEVLLIFTDMYGPMPDNCSKDTIWITSSKGVDHSFGNVVEADFND